MTNKEILLNWLAIALQQPPNRHSELFYFDNRENQFFSILVSDYFLFDEQLNLANSTTSTYSKRSLESLQDRIRRIDNNDLSIVAIPRLGEINEAENQKQVELFVNSNKVNLDTVTIWETEDEGTITIKIPD
jgi:hypothetical protein